MKFTLSWLKDHLDTTASLDTIVERLTMIGLEVEGVEDKARLLAPFVTAYVVSAVQHPTADRLRVCMVDIGHGEPIQVVCGAPNARTGLKSVFSPPGTYIPGKNITLGVGSIRGVESRGMLCSAAELELSEDHDGIIELPEDAPIGVSYTAYAGLGDPVIDINLTPNRADCTGVRGIARDLAAAEIGTLKPDPIRQTAGSFASPIGVDLRFGEGETVACPAFFGRFVRGVTNGPSPDWLQKRLRAVGLRPISALVDMTNFISLDRGRPLHVFDAAKVSGRVHARFGRAGESLVALDGKTYPVDERTCVIADDSGAISIGGIMGGEATGCTEATTDVFIECAWFDPLVIAETGRRLGLNSDARYRFERGIDPAFMRAGLDYATQMVLDLCGGTASDPVIAGAPPELERVIEFPLAEVKRLAGLDLHRVEIRHILARLGFLVVGSGDVVRVAVPSWRADVHGRADLVEEIVRIHGVGHVPLKPLEPTGHVNGKVLTLTQIRRGRARRQLAARGLLEAVTWSFVSKPLATHFGGGAPDLALANPIAADLSDMRPSLLPGLIAAAQRNADRGTGDVGLFEVGQIFRNDTPGGQKLAAAGVRRGTAVATGAGRHWSGTAPIVSWMDAKADALAVLEAIGAPVDKLQLTRSVPGWFHPGRSGTLQLGPQAVLAHFGEVHPKTLAALDVSGPLVAFEIFLDALVEPKARATRSKGPLQVSEFQSVARDFAFVVDEAVEADRILKAVRGADKGLIASVNLFDVFRGASIGDGRKSVAVELTLAPKDRTLTEEEIDAVSAKVVAAVAKATGATLRT